MGVGTMIYPGVCSLTLGQLSPAEVVTLCKETGLTHVEWWGRDNGHVPMGDVATAASVGEMTREAGLTIPTYGSYYCVGESEAEGLAFDAVLKTAIALGAPAIRVWAGTKGTDTVTPEQRRAVIDDSLRIAELCAEQGITAVFEYHQGTLTDSNASAVALAAALAALEDEAHLVKTRRLVDSGLRVLSREFKRMGLEYVEGVANFLLVRVGNGREVFEGLKKNGVIVRPMDVYGLPEHIRVTVGKSAENRRFIACLKEVLGQE